MNTINYEDLNKLIDKIGSLWLESAYDECSKNCNILKEYLNNYQNNDENIIKISANLYRYIGNLDYIHGNYALALENYIASLDYSECLKDNILIANVSNNIGTIYKNLNDTYKALMYFEKAKEKREQMNDFENLYITYNNLANIYADMASADNDQVIEEKSRLVNIAFIYLLSSLKIFTLHNIHEKQSISTLNNIASLLLEMDETQKAFNEYTKAKLLSEKYNAKKSLIHSLLGLADCHSKLKEYPQALEYLFKAEEQAISCKAKDKLKLIYKDISEIFTIKEDYKNACKYQSMFCKLQAEIFNEDFKNKLLNLETKFEIEQKKKELEIYKLKNIELVKANNEIYAQKIELEQLNENKNNFLGIVVHDLKNPISCILGLCDLSEYHIINENSKDDSHKKNIVMIKSQAEKMYKMLNDLLDISAIESGKIKVNLEDSSLEEIFLEREFYYKLLADKKNISLTINRENINTRALIDKDRIVEVLDNLITNAIKFTYNCGVIDIRFAIKNDKLLVSVTDNGQGFKPCETEKLFKEFIRFSAKPTAGETSTGFGLMIVKKIIDLHNGKIYVQSEKNKGSTFTIELNKIT